MIHRECSSSSPAARSGDDRLGLGRVYPRKPFVLIEPSSVSAAQAPNATGLDRGRLTRRDRDALDGWTRAIYDALVLRYGAGVRQAEAAAGAAIDQLGARDSLWWAEQLKALLH